MFDKEVPKEKRLEMILVYKDMADTIFITEKAFKHLKRENLMDMIGTEVMMFVDKVEGMLE